MAAKIRKGDRVQVLAGRDKGKRGEVLRVMPTEDRALVLQGCVAGVDGVAEALFFADLGEEAGAHAAGEDVHGGLLEDGIGMIVGDGVPGEADLGLVGVLGDVEGAAHGGLGLQGRGRACGPAAEAVFDPDDWPPERQRELAERTIQRLGAR